MSQRLRSLLSRRRRADASAAPAPLWSRGMGGVLPRAGLAALFVTAVVVLLPPVRSRVEAPFRAGDVADYDVVAPFAFRVPLSGDELRVARARASLGVPPVYVRSRRVERELAADLATLLDSVATVVYASGLADDERVMRAAQWLPGVSRGTLRDAIAADGFSSLRAAIRESHRDLMARGVIDNAAVLRRNNFREIFVIDGTAEERRSVSGLVDPASLEDLLRTEASARLGDGPRAELFYEVVRGHALANLTFDAADTARRRDEVAAAVKEYFELSKGERVVARGERVTREQEVVLRALEEARAARSPERSRWVVVRAYLAEIMRVTLFCALFAVYLLVFHRGIVTEFGRLMALFAVMLVYVAIVALVVRFGWNPYVVPVAFVSVMLAALFDHRLGLIAGAFAATLLPLAAPIGAGPTFVAWLAGAAGVAGIERMRERSRGYAVFASVAAAYAVGVLAVEGGGASSWTLVGEHVMWGVVNGFVTGAAIVFLLPVFEQVFNRASRFTLLELTDLNKPILRRLNMDAAGTYHHSMLLGNLVDAIAGEIGADPLRARVMAYYHDIGKIQKPEYFAENQEPGLNKHEKITPQMSALILVSHVKDGVELALQEKLPEVVVDGIREHHGTTVMAYFYQKALETDSHSSVNRSDFRYPGPRPRSKESALLMCADTVEAAVRSLRDPTPAQIRAMVTRLVDARAQDGELDESGITLADLTVIKERLVTMLATIYNKRVAYPGQEGALAPEDWRAAGESVAESG